MKPYAVTHGGVRLALQIVPRAARNGVDGISSDRQGRPVLKLKLTAPALEGAANQALIAFLAKSLSLNKADISIRSGDTSRFKIIHLSGDSVSILGKLDTWLA